MQQLIEIEIGREEASVAMPFENAQRGRGSTRRHQACFAHRRQQMIFIGREKKRGHGQALQRGSNVVSREDAQPVAISHFRGAACEQEEISDLVLMRVRRVQPPRRETADPLHGVPRHQMHRRQRGMQLGARGDAGERIEDDQFGHAFGVPAREGHGQRATERFPHHHDRFAGRDRHVEMMQQIGDERVHVCGFVTQAKREHAKPVSQQAGLAIEEQSRSVESGHVDERPAGPRGVQTGGRIEFDRGVIGMRDVR